MSLDLRQLLNARQLPTVNNNNSNKYINNINNNQKDLVTYYFILLLFFFIDGHSLSVEKKSRALRKISVVQIFNFPF